MIREGDIDHNKRTASIINSLSSMFFAAYYIDLEKDTFQPVTQEEEVVDVLGDERNYTQGINTYAQKFVCPDDREEYLSCVNRQNLMNTLRDGQTFIATEYRKMPNEKNQRTWTRATVVLAEAAQDGSPRRAVYVA
ncbi:MAG: hypothetical protein K2P35_02525, partial [Lachnospiraceae bacterium]|nr:hypothetical protein [Lachnospiraceae bacterium]